MRTYYIAICFGYWGRGDDEATALKNCHKAGGGKTDTTMVYRITTSIEEDGGKFWLLLNGERIKAFDSLDDLKPYVDGSGTMAFYGEREKIATYRKGKRYEEVGSYGEGD